MGKYRSVSVAEKRQLLADAGEPWPKCDCHGVDKLWHARPDQKPGGSWQCAERKRERVSEQHRKRYAKDPAGQNYLRYLRKVRQRIRTKKAKIEVLEQELKEMLQE